MGGRDPDEPNRQATPLELFFDLTFVTSFGLAALQYAHALAEGHYGPALIGFGFASFAICWAWINFSWFASAYDTDDWIFRVATMVQMTGVLVVGIGLPRMFASVEHGQHLDAGVIVAGYVVMRLALGFQWLRAARQDPARRRACLTYAAAISVAQIGWIALSLADPALGTALLLVLVLMVVELAGPVLAERRDGGTPWHAHHIAERYGLFAIIALGEGVVGTIAALTAVTGEKGWTSDAVLTCVAGIGLTFAMWWIYFILPSARILHAHRDRSFVWGYAQMATVASIVATGAGLHVAANFIEHQAHIGAVATVLSVALPLAIFIGSIYALYTYLVGRFDRFHIGLLGGTTAVLVLAVVAALAGVDMAVCLIILMLAPGVTVVGYEARGYRHQIAVATR
ncbi:low temperature requirement protein A [Rhizobiales bacterium L72]|uniref:Low temperature requirement protein A n=2 Tax=Propylenella binzhouense TaxID=2555902 RepID=A0A964T6P5_9HYPH|nr:low temperature requirement protein A [Propylenella binzhouense]MYZ48824.1 low temperature requirement protein A [Propylenella binzhouense]